MPHKGWFGVLCFKHKVKGLVMENEFWSKFVEQMLLYFLPILASALLGLILMGFRLLWVKFKQAQPKLASILEFVAYKSVVAAEQAGAAGIIDGKKEYALEVAQKWLKAQGLNIDTQVIGAAIEAAVWEEFNQWKHKPLPESDDSDGVE